MKNLSEIFGVIEDKTGIGITGSKNLSGGCISDAYMLTTIEGKNLFLKFNDNMPDDFFVKEANGLLELSKPGSIIIPQVIMSERNFIVTGFIKQGNPHKNFFREFGFQFAELHKTTSDSFGFYEDNFIGSTVQLNIPDENQKKDWINFYFDKRLLFQLRLAEKNGYADSELRSSFIQLEKRMNSILGGADEKPSLLHGDLWSGNFMTNEEGKACLIDPAVYYGNREADLAMTKLFGGFTTDFYSSYNETYPLTEDYHYRENIYKLYHVLNHLNLFGGSYYYQAVNLIRGYLK